MRKGTVLLTYSIDLSSAEPETETMLKSTLVGVVKEKLFEEGEIVQPGYACKLTNVIILLFNKACSCVNASTCTCR